MKYRQKSRKWQWLVYLLLGLAGVATALLFLPRYEAGYRLFLHLLIPAPAAPERTEGPGKEPGKEAAKEPAGSERKNIYDRNFNELAVNVPMASVYARPLELKDNRQAVPELAAMLGLDEKKLQATLAAERNFVWLGRHLSLKVAEQVAARDYKGIYLDYESQRLYPYRQLAAHVVGFVNEEQGLAGVEYTYDNLLRGGALAGFENLLVTPQGEPAVIGSAGINLVLTLDMRMQSLVEKKLLAALAASSGTSGTAILMAPATGQILSLVNVPSYDPNAFRDYDLELRRNRAITEPIYPTGLQPFFKIGAALAAGWRPAAAERGPPAVESKPEAAVMEPHQKKTRVVASEVVPGESTWHQLADGLYQAPASGWPAEQPLAEGELEKLVAALGLRNKSGIDLPDEGGANEKASGPDSFRLGNPQAVTTPVHLVTAFSRLLNGGRPVVPHLLAGVWDAAKQERIEARFAPGEPIFASDFSAELGGILTRLTPPGGEAAVVESLVAAHTLPAEGPADEKKEEAATEPPAAPPPQSASSARPRYHAVLLGAVPAEKPEMVLLMVVDGAQVEVAQPSPFRGLGAKLLQQVLPLARQPGAERPPATATPEASYERWQQLQNSQEVQAGERRTEAVDKMPLVVGVSLRKALQVLQTFDLKVKVKGSGRVVKQQPAAGTPLAGIEECTLELQVDQ